MNGPDTSHLSAAERKQYLEAWNTTMLDIWEDRIHMLRVIDTGALLNSLTALQIKHDDQYIKADFEHRFMLYGLYQDRGTGREVPLGNPGDIGRDKVRKQRRWFSSKYWSSVNNMTDFMARNVAKEATGAVVNILK